MRFRLATSFLTAAVCLSFAFAGSAAAAPKKRASPKVLFQGCAVPAVPPGCLVINQNGKSFNVTGATPPIPVGSIVTGSGDPTSPDLVCPGTKLNDIIWRPTGAACM
jgi:hypothetical protein